MKDTEIHNGLEKKEIRDLLSESIVNAYEKELSNRKQLPPLAGLTGLTHIDLTIEKTKIAIESQQNELEKLKTIRATLILANNHGWNEYDISDYVEKSDKNKMWRTFFGTEEEYNLFMKTNGFK